MQQNNSNKGFLLKSFSFVAAANIFTKPLWVFLFIFAARKLGTEQFGIYSLAFSVVSILTIFMELSMDYILVREYNLNKNNLNTIVSSIISLRLLVTSIIYILLFLYGVINNLFYDIQFYSVLILFTFQVLTYFLSFYKAIISMFQEFRTFSIMMVVEKMFLIILGFLALFLSYTLLGFIVSLLLANVISLIVFSIILNNRKIKFIKTKTEDMLKILKLALPFLFINIFMVIYFRLDILLLNYIIQDNHITGIYGSIHRLIEMYILLPTIFMSMGYPVITANYFNNKEFALKYTKKIINILLALSLILAATISVNSFFINKIIYGNQYSEGSKGLMFLIWVIVPNSVNFVLGNLVIIISKEKLSILILGIASVINVLLNLILIRYLSFIGACITALVSEIIIFNLYSYFITKYFGNIDLKKTTLKIFSISLIIVLFNFTFNFVVGYSPYFSIIINFILSIILIIWFNIISIKDFVELLSIVKFKRNS